METIDVVYVLGTGSNWSNNEIRFSLRSLEKNLKGMGRVFIVGELPDFIQGVVHIQHPDEYGPAIPDGNIIKKVLRAIADPSLSENFLFINDDHVLLKPVVAEKIPYFHKGDLNSFPDSYFENKNRWRKTLKRTRDVLNFKGLTALHFDCHTPMLINKTLFPEVMGQFDYGVDKGYTMKSLYANSAGVKPILLEGQKKVVFEHYTKSQLDERLKSCSFLSFNDGGLNLELKIWLNEKFPKMSKYEMTGYSDMLWDIAKALLTPNNKELIRKTFIKYGRERNLVSMVEREYNDNLHEKILFKLKRMLP
jgi:hypothetical protein